MRKLTALIICCLFILSLIFTQSLSPVNMSNQVYQKNGANYISLNEYAKNHEISTEFYEYNEKLILRIPNSKTVVSKNCSFIKIRNIIYQLDSPVSFDGTEFFIHAKSFERIIKMENLPYLQLEYSQKTSIALGKDYNILGLMVEKVGNETIIEIKTNRRFLRDEVAVTFASQ